MAALLAYLMLGLVSAAEMDFSLGLPAAAANGKRMEDVRRVSLGRQLFFDSRLSADGKVSCSKCHIPDISFTDGRAHSAGLNDRVGTRNAPTLLNVAYAGTLFWDGRATDLESQALAPLTNPTEHALSSQEAIEEIVRSDPAYAREFGAVFAVTPDRISSQLVATALAAYERTLLAGGSAFDRYLYGHDRSALNPEARRGLELFRGRGQCASCHQIGASSALLTDGDYHVAPMGIPMTVTGKLPQLARTVVALSAERPKLERLIATDPEVAALGRFVVTLNPADIGKFKTPSLRNVALTAPYMHDGSVETLEDAIQMELYGRKNALSYPIPLTATERHELLEFLRSLTSPRAAR